MEGRQHRQPDHVGGVDRLRRFLLEGGVPEMRTGRAEKPIPSASNPSTWVNCCGRGREDACSHQITETTPRSSRLGLGTTSKLAPMSGRPPVFFRYFNGHLRVTTISR